MFYGHLSAEDAYRPLLANPHWAFAFDWLRAAGPNLEPGIRPLRGEDIYVNVHGYRTVPREQARYESHRRYVDLQYCITGGELIDWQLASTLRPDGGYDEAKDLQFYELGTSPTTVQMVPGSYAIFYPSDAHLPKRTDGTNPEIFKVVVKIAHRLVER